LAVLAVLPQEPTPAAPTPIEVCASATIASAREALAHLSAAAVAGPAPHRPFAVVYLGSAAIEAHLARPGERSTSPVKLEIERLADQSLRVRETRGAGGRSRTTELLLARDGGYRRENSGPWETLSEAEARAVTAESERYFPATLLAAADRARAGCRPGAPVRFEERDLASIHFADAAGATCSLLLDSERRLVRAETLRAHPVYGDVCEWARYDDYFVLDGVLLPRRIARFLAPRDVTIEHRLEFVSFRSGAAPDAPANADGPSSRPAPQDAVRIVALETGIFAVESELADARALAVERERDFVLLEAPGGDDVTTAMLAALAAATPGKPVSVVACGHHHPSPSGGLRAVAAAGAELLLPEQLADHYRRHLARPATLGSPIVAGPKEPRFGWFRGETRIEAGANDVVLLDIGARSDHTEHYVVFYFPATGLLFEGDLGWFPAEGAPRVGSRLRGLAAALAERGIRPRNVVQSWPVRGARRLVPWSAIEAQLAPAASRPTSAPPLPESAPVRR
jgi:glyoxylase-like metal-dependent hydrolase (beta-lactamase superfamily II)